MKRTIRLAAALAALWTGSGPLAAQAPACADSLVGRLGGLQETQYRLAQLAGTAPVESMLLRRSEPDRLRPGCDARDGALAVTVLPVDVISGYRSGYDGGRNDELLWQGRGLSALVTGGLSAEWGPLRVALAPAAAWQQNSEYEIAPVPAKYSPFANPWYVARLDIPQRFGDESFTSVGWGQSAVSLRVSALEFGLSNQNLWWGPGQWNSLLMTNTAEGMPHVHLSTRRAIGTPVGDFEGTFMVGEPRVSEYFDSTRTRTRLFRGLALTWAPPFVDNVSVGAARVFMMNRPDKLGAWVIRDFIEHPLAAENADPDNPGGNSRGNQLLSFFGRWVLPESQLELYGEWGREDHSWDVKDLLTQPDHSQAWVLGMQKLFGNGADRTRFAAEWAQLQNYTPPRPERPLPKWYTHFNADYTVGGQWLGTATGTGGNSQHVRLERLRGDGRSLGVTLERVRRYDPAYYEQRTGTLVGEHDAEVSLAVHGASRIGGSMADLSLEFAHRYNRLFMNDDSSINILLRWTSARSISLR